MVHDFDLIWNNAWFYNEKENALGVFDAKLATRDGKALLKTPE